MKHHFQIMEEDGIELIPFDQAVDDTLYFLADIQLMYLYNDIVRMFNKLKNLGYR